MTEETVGYQQLVEVGQNSLAANERWCILDPGGEPMLETASKRFDDPVRRFCDAVNCDWEDAKEAGYRLGRVTIPTGM